MKKVVNKIRAVVFIFCAHGSLMRGRVSTDDFYTVLNFHWLEEHTIISRRYTGEVSERVWDSIGGRGLF
jgi:hypothetical protein